MSQSSCLYKTPSKNNCALRVCGFVALEGKWQWRVLVDGLWGLEETGGKLGSLEASSRGCAPAGFSMIERVEMSSVVAKRKYSSFDGRNYDQWVDGWGEVGG